jgi:hypothetical protein
MIFLKLVRIFELITLPKVATQNDISRTKTITYSATERQTQ